MIFVILSLPSRERLRATHGFRASIEALRVMPERRGIRSSSRPRLLLVGVELSAAEVERTVDGTGAD